jgi:hypothetical protein
MSGLRRVTQERDNMVTSWTECSVCGKRLASSQEWSNCQRLHTLERLHQTEEGRRLFAMLKNAGFKP